MARLDERRVWLMNLSQGDRDYIAINGMDLFLKKKEQEEREAREREESTKKEKRARRQKRIEESKNQPLSAEFSENTLEEISESVIEKLRENPNLIYKHVLETKNEALEELLSEKDGEIHGLKQSLEEEQKLSELYRTQKNEAFDKVEELGKEFQKRIEESLTQEQLKALKDVQQENTDLSEGIFEMIQLVEKCVKALESTDHEKQLKIAEKVKQIIKEIFEPEQEGKEEKSEAKPDIKNENMERSHDVGEKK
jgi:hypothetical protein